ncbi:MAG: hypothetical protein ABI877_08175, partial [Gemmatimonadaceae bacterium]
MRGIVVLAAAVALAAPHALWAQQRDSLNKAAVDSTPHKTVSIGKDTLHIAGLTIPAGERRRGPVVVAGGDLIVRGTIEGNAIAILGDVIVPAGGRVTGDAIAALGELRVDGQVDGEAREINTFKAGGDERAAASEVSKSASTMEALRLACGWLIVLLLIGLGVLVFAGNYLDGVVDVLEQNFWRSLGVGLLGGVSLVPILALVIAGLAISLIGILLIPFAAVAYLLAAAGLVTLGFLAVARVTGNSVGSAAVRRLSSRGSTLRSLVIGIVVYLGPWVLAAALSWAPIPAGILRAIAFVVTCVAATAGFGAAILSRAGSRRELPAGAPASAPDPVGWQTPTPVTGV